MTVYLAIDPVTGRVVSMTVAPYQGPRDVPYDAALLPKTGGIGTWVYKDGVVIDGREIPDEEAV